MRAMVLSRTGDVSDNRLALRERAVPKPEADQVLVKIHVCGVCRTDLHVVEGELPGITLPLIPGHQAVGTVAQVGRAVQNIREGDRVGLAWLQGTCGACEFCTSGRENLCEAAQFTGYQVDGGYAEYTVAPERFTYPLPPVFSDDEAAPLLCAGIIGYRALRLSGIKPGQRLGLYGFGASAHIAIQIARHWGCQVYVSSLKPEHQKLAKQLGAVWVGGATDMPPDKLHGSIIFAPAGELVPPALRALERGSTLALAGIHMSPIPTLDYDREIFGERIIRSVTANTRQDGIDLLREAAAIRITPHTVRFALEDANRALQALKAGGFQGAAILTI
ncbi:MAG: zinc-dependent alcohol dehydrogenase family protein [Nitrospira sp.]|nr:zinc-dependent alcohol dehydrogenase family protein [Nitrospira sp.]MBH0196473.1 zinc-dependent alcohol dehydrogenase family protein [Nitrospira sp.]